VIVWSLALLGAVVWAAGSRRRGAPATLSAAPSGARTTGPR